MVAAVRDSVCRFAWPACALALLLLACIAVPVSAAEPIKIGFSMSLTGNVAASGKAVLLSDQIWAEDVNEKGGLLGRPVELVYYDDQSNPGLVPGIYTKLLDVDKVDLLAGVGTNLVVPAMPIVTERQKIMMATLALAVNEQFHYPKYFQTMPYGPDGKDAVARGFFEIATTLNPKPRSVALVGADAEFANNALAGARANAKRLGLKIVYDRTYPPNTVDFSGIVRGIQAAQPDLLFVGSYPSDTVGMVRAANEASFKPKLFGGAMVGLQYAAVKSQMGDLLNGIVNYELYVHEPTMQFPGIEKFLKTYQSRAAAQGVDQLGYYQPPFAYATLQVLAQAIEKTGSLDSDKLADTIHKSEFETVVGPIRFGPDGEWATPRILHIQFQGVKGNGLEQFMRDGTQVILYPPQFKSGELR